MKYPKLPFELNKARKLSDADIKEMKRLRLEDGLTYKKIAETFDVDYSTVYYHMNEDYRKTQLKRAGKRISEKWQLMPKEEKKELQKSRYAKHEKRKRQLQGDEIAAYRKEWDSVNALNTPEKRRKHNESSKKWQATPQGRDYRKKYNQSRYPKEGRLLP